MSALISLLVSNATPPNSIRRYVIFPELSSSSVPPNLAAINGWARQAGQLANNIDPVTFTAGSVLVNPVAATTTPDFKPVSGSPALSGADFVNNPILAGLISASGVIENPVLVPVFPNPVFDGDLYFGREVASFGIFDLAGRLLKHGFYTDHANVTGLPTGLYLINLEGSMQKFVVE